MNVDGQDIELTAEGRKSGADVSDWDCLTHQEYVGKGVIVQVDLQKTGGCPPESEECEVSDYNATITAEKGGMRQVVKGKGSCGC
jgi:hypothetical protein